MFSLKVVFVMLCLQTICHGQFEIPKVTLEAFKPRGLRVSIPADSETELFAFHGKVNEEIAQIEPGDFSGDIKNKIEGRLTYFNPNLQLKKGDIVNYWYFVQNNQLGYRKDGQKWVVSEVKELPGKGCEESITKLSDRSSVCRKAVILQDNFDSGLDENKWTWEQYMPAHPDYEFLFYKKDKDVTFIRDNRLCIKPKLRQDTEQLMKKESVWAELSDGCTRPALCSNITFLIRNPVVSGRLESKIAFSYGEFEIKARVPSGDWIYPEIYLEDPQGRRILIAYTRGNLHLTGNAGDDLGNNILFGGPVKEHLEPKRSSKLSSYRNGAPLSDASHVYKLIWTNDNIELYIDGSKYGEVATDPNFTRNSPSKFKLVLGVGVGGVNDFPNHYKSGDNVKPWINFKSTQVKDFYNSRNTWYPTWSEEGRQLQVDYVKVTAI